MSEIKQEVQKHNITQPIFVESDLKLNDTFDNQYVPAYYVFDKEGKLRHFQAGGSVIKMLTKTLLIVY
nr:hypothetical protein [Bacillus timonensis]